VGAVRPKFEEEKRMDNIPGSAHKEGVEWGRNNSILKGDTSGSLQPV